MDKRKGLNFLAICPFFEVCHYWRKQVIVPFFSFDSAQKQKESMFHFEYSALMSETEELCFKRQWQHNVPKDNDFYISVPNKSTLSHRLMESIWNYNFTYLQSGFVI